jgi:LysM repeat protein
MFDVYLRRRLAFVLVLLLLVLGGLRFASPSSGAAPAVRYTVQTGDTLWGIASERYGGDPRGGVDAIRSANRLDDASIRPGEVLLLPSR